MADLCEKVGANVLDVAKGMGLDQRIGQRFLHAGPGYGGSCFPKDTLALTRTGQQFNSPIRIIETVVEVNEARKRRMVDKIMEALDDRLAGAKIAVFGVTFKPDTDDMRAAPSLTVVPALIGAGAQVTVVDPHGRKEGEALLPGVTWAEDPYAAAAGADAAVVLTEWNMFRGLDLRRLRAAMKAGVLIDLRNVYRPSEAVAAGFAYTSIGRPREWPQAAAKAAE
jgi:UDPglucose 6-dehydrogenase